MEQLKLVLFKTFFKVKIYIFRFIVPYIIELIHKYENMLNENQLKIFLSSSSVIKVVNVLNLNSVINYCIRFKL